MFGSSRFKLSVVSSRLRRCLPRFGVAEPRCRVAFARWRCALCLVLFAWPCPAMSFAYTMCQRVNFTLQKPWSGDLKTKIYTETQCLAFLCGRPGIKPDLVVCGDSTRIMEHAWDMTAGFLRGDLDLDIDHNTKEQSEARENAMWRVTRKPRP